MLRQQNEQHHLFEALLPFDLIDTDRELEIISDFLDENPAILEEFTKQLKLRSENSKTLGRPSEPAEAILRMLIYRRTYSLSFRATSRTVNDSLVLRKFTRIYYESVPNYSTLARYDNLLSEETLKRMNEHIVHGAQKCKITKGRKMRQDTTAVEANIHYPTDSHLLYDCVRVLSRTAQQCKKIGLATGEKTRNFTRSAKKQLLKVVKYARARNEDGQAQFKKTYKNMINITKRCLSYARHLTETAAQYVSDKTVQKVYEQLKHYIPLTEQVIDQTQRRIFKNESVPNNEKIISIFQPGVYTIRKGKRAKPNEFGKLLELQQSDGKIITHWKTHSSNVSDSSQFESAIKRHIETFGKPPYLAAGDRGFSSPENEIIAKELGIKRVCLPKKGKKSKKRTSYEKQPWFKAGQRFRAGIEGTISVLKRRHGFDRCMNTGDFAFDRWVGLGIIAYNLMIISKA